MEAAPPFESVTGPLGRPVTPQPRLLKSTYLAEGESLLRETRATRLHFLPGPVLAVVILLFLDYADGATLAGWTSFPLLGGAFSWIHDRSGTVATYAFYFLLFLTLLALLWLFVRYLRYISTVYAVTTQRVIIQTGILGREFDEIPLLQIRGVDVHQTFGQRMLGFGTMWISSEGGAHAHIGNEAWAGIPKPFEFQRLVEGASQNLAQGRPMAYR